MAQSLLKGAKEGRFFRANLHCHSGKSEGLLRPEEVVVEVYNHNCALAAVPDWSNDAYTLDGLLERGRRAFVSAGDDAHFGHPRDRFGGWAEVYCDRLDPDALPASLEAGRYYSTQGEARLEQPGLAVVPA